MSAMAPVTDNSSHGENFVERVTIWHQFRALFLKDLTLQWRAIFTNICQLLTPIIFILFAGIMQLILNVILKKHGSVVPGTEVPFFPPTNPGRLVSCSYNDSAPHHAQDCHYNIFNFFDEFPNWSEWMESVLHGSFVEQVESFALNASEHNVSLPVNVSEVIANITEDIEQFELVGESAVQDCQEALFDLPLYFVGESKDAGKFKLGNFTGVDVNRTGFLGGMVPDQWYYDFPLNFDIRWHSNDMEDFTCPAFNEYEDSIVVPQFWKIENYTLLNDHLIEIVKEYNLLAQKTSLAYDQYDRNYEVSPLSKNQYVSVMEYIQNRTLEKIKPHGGIFVNSYNESAEAVSLFYTMVADDLVLWKYSPANGTGFNSSESSDFGKNISTGFGIEIHRRSGIINMMSNALFKYLLTSNLNNSSNDTYSDYVPITTYIMPLLSTPTNITIDISTLLGGILFPFAASFLIPVYMSSIVKDKFEKHLIMMEQNGLSRWTYWLVTYTFNYMLYIPIAIEIGIFAYIFKMRIFTQTSPLVMIITFLLWGHAEVVLGFFFSNFFSRPRTATIVGYLLVIAGIVVALLLEALQVFPEDQTPFPVYMMYPPFAFYRILQYLNLGCLSMQCYSTDTLSPAGGLNVVTTALLYLGFSTIGLMFVSIYLSFVLPSEYGVRKSPFFPIIAVYKGVRYLLSKCGQGHSEVKNRELHVSVTPPPDSRIELDEVDEDVQAEEDALRRRFPDNAPIVIYQLRKEYPGSSGKPPHIAVHSLSLAIQRNECFGLLGPNGAGKTTLISVLTGLYEPTKGTAVIAGFDITTNINDIHRHLGVCPQFDIQHADLTAEEHLLFYARLKGVKWSRERAVVEKALRQVNLYEARKRKSKALSGGMRRRLSVAMACIGNPDILILDEPTTGLDPASRRQVWEVIESIKAKRSVILTTHAMEEADHLCTRIGIMNYGRLRCLGTQNRLKTRFGSGYQLTFQCAPGCAPMVENFVQTNLPKAVHVETYADSCSYKVEKEDLCVSELFELIDTAKVEVGIQDWGIKMTTLEDVFLNIVKQNTDDRTPDSRSLCPSWLPCHCCARRKTTVDE